MEKTDVAPLAVMATDIPVRGKKSNYPEPFASRMDGRTKRQVGNFLGLVNFGVNLTTLAPGAQSALMHRHTRQDEMIYVLQGTPTLVTDEGEVELKPGMCAGFPAGGVAHHIVNRSQNDAVYLEIGDRTRGDEVSYPADDIQAVMGPDGWIFAHKDGTPY